VTTSTVPSLLHVSDAIVAAQFIKFVDCVACCMCPAVIMLLRCANFCTGTTFPGKGSCTPLPLYLRWSVTAVLYCNCTAFQ
jgi:hypothetical protein